MNEHLLQLIASLKIVWVAVFSYLYGEGGIANKWLRRYIGGAWIGLGIFAFGMWEGHFIPWNLIGSGLLIGALHLGYGGDTVPVKLRKRTIYGGALGISSIVQAITSHLWILFGINILLCLLASILFGVLNPFKNARDEETNIATLSCVLPMYMI